MLCVLETNNIENARLDGVSDSVLCSWNQNVGQNLIISFSKSSRLVLNFQVSKSGNEKHISELETITTDVLKGIENAKRNEGILTTIPNRQKMGLENFILKKQFRLFELFSRQKIEI